VKNLKFTKILFETFKKVDFIVADTKCLMDLYGMWQVPFDPSSKPAYDIK
jgi:hypothetical protein